MGPAVNTLSQQHGGKAEDTHKQPEGRRIQSCTQEGGEPSAQGELSLPSAAQRCRAPPRQQGEAGAACSRPPHLARAEPGAQLLRQQLKAVGGDGVLGVELAQEALLRASP